MKRVKPQNLYLMTTKTLKLCLLSLCLLVNLSIFTANKAQAQQLSPQQFITDIREGRLSTDSAAQVLSNSGISDAQEVVDNLTRISDIETAGDLLGEFLQGNISEQILQELSENINLGEIEDLLSIERIMQNLGVTTDIDQLLQSMNLGEITDFVENITGLLGGPEAIRQLATQAGAQAIAGILNDVAPGIVQALGGEQAVADAINAAAGGSGTTSSGGSTPPGDDGGHNCCQCQRPIQINHQRIRAHVTNEFNAYRFWFVNDMFKQNVLPAWQLMANQLTAAAMQQVAAVGMFFDAKHQLETQRLFQILTAEAHKDYHPSEGVCTFGTNMRSLASSERKSDLTHRALASRGMQRQLSGAEGISASGLQSDKESRIKSFIEYHCDPADNGNGFDRFCEGTTSTPERRNKDVNYTQTIENALTLDLDLSDTSTTPDEIDVMALTTNLMAHDTLPVIAERLLADGNNTPTAVANNYLDLRSIAAKRSVAQNSIHAIIALKANGETGSRPYLYRIMEDLGVRRSELQSLIGNEPSYFAQMEILTKHIYQNPEFYADLYDKPANVERKGAVLQAIGLMQDRDTFDSLIRSEAALATLLETLLQKEHRRVSAKLIDVDSDGVER